MKTILIQAIAQITARLRAMSLKGIHLEKLLIAGAASLLLLFTTACNPTSTQASNPHSTGAKNTNSYTQRVGQSTDLYDTVQPRTDGMNQYNDDFRYDAGQSKGKAERLVRQAEDNLEKVQSPKDYVENLKDTAQIKDRTGNVAKNVKERAENLAEDIAEGTKRGTRNLKQNVDKAGRNLDRATDEANQEMRAAAREAQRQAERNL